MFMKKFLLLFTLCVVLSSCSFESEGVFTDDTTEEYELYDYYVDSYGNEGIVAYIHQSTSSERKYVIVISADESYQSWGPMGERVYKSDSVSSSVCRSSGFGVAVLQAMHSIGIDRYPAQSWCDSKNEKEEYPRAGSWRLPSFHEFGLIRGANGSKIESLNSALKGIGGTPILTDHLYWTCAEDFDNYITINGEDSDYDRENRAVITSPMNATYSNKERWLKKNRYYARAIKYVYYHD